MSTIRTYRAASAREALELVRAELGSEALILGQREVRHRPFPWHRRKVETVITAALGARKVEPVMQRESGTAHATSPADRDKTTARHERPVETKSVSVSRPVAAATESQAERPPLSQAVSSHGDHRFRLYTQLLEQDVDADIARVLLGELQTLSATAGPWSPDEWNRHSRAMLAESIPCGGGIQVTPGQRRIVALVGPTGVGKTTTVAKLAAHFRLRDRLRVALVTVDTYRVAAVEQLRTYADLIDVPMHVVTTPREMPAVLDDLADRDLVLIDTVGRSPSDELRIQELRSFLQAAHADEVHLVASLTAGVRNFARTVERFQRVGPTSLLLTKLDEATGPGAVVSAAWEANLPLSYITTGQDVPQDIETADPDVIAQRVLPSGNAMVADEREPAKAGEAFRLQSRVA
ncbi:MAG: flagellar biosynthesis protein FlhF [Planctomycetaceae bacterium]